MQFFNTLVAGSLVGVALSSVPAAAQEADSPTDEVGLQDIVVTAQRRSEKLQNVPISISAADSETLSQARVDNVSNLSTVTPSVTFRTSNISSSAANVVIRGLGTTGISRSFEGSTGVFIDGVYRSRASAALQNFLDIDNLQVLRGPQGTLFGKNTNAGALLLSSARPTVTKPEYLFDASVGNFNTIVARAAGNIPISETTAIRIGGLFSRRDGIYQDSTTRQDLNDDQTQAVKAQLLTEPSDSLTIRVIADYSHSSGNCCYATVSLIDGVTQPLIDSLIRAGGRTVPSTRAEDRQQTLNGNGHQTIEDYGATLLIDFEASGGTVKSITAYREFSLRQRDVDGDMSGADVLQLGESFKSRFISQELTYNTKIDAINADAVFGIFIADEKLTMGRSLRWGAQAQAYWNALLGANGVPAGTANASPGVFAIEDMGGKAQSFAGFAHLDMALGSKLNLIGGLRYSVERKEGRFIDAFYRTSSPTEMFTLLGIGPSPAYDRSITYRSLSGTVGLQFRPAEDVMLYATFNRGFKSGGVNIDRNGAGTLYNNQAFFNTLPVPVQNLAKGVSGNSTFAPPLDPVYRPETINAYEAGAKFEYFGRRARTNVAFFYYDLDDVQIAQFIGTRFAVINANSAKAYGLDVENLFELTPGVKLALDGTWIPKAQYGVDPTISPGISGNRFRYAPRLSANATLNFDLPVSDTVNATGRLQYQYTSTQLINPTRLVNQGPVSLVNASLGLRLPDSGLAIEVWGQNLFDRSYYTFGVITGFQVGDMNAYVGAPRSYGLRMRAAF